MFLTGKRILIMGLLSNRSIAYGIARACRAQGAELAFTYQNERFRDRVTEMAAEFGSDAVFACDVGEDTQIAALFEALGQRWDGLDGLVHAIAYAPREAISGDFFDGFFRIQPERLNDLLSKLAQAAADAEEQGDPAAAADEAAAAILAGLRAQSSDETVLRDLEGMLVDLEIWDPVPSERRCVKWALDRFHELFDGNIRALLKVCVYMCICVMRGWGFVKAA